jgi:hypothetical protein
MKDLSTAIDNRMAIADIKRQYDMGKIDRNEAKRLAQPVLDSINARSLEIAQKHGKKKYPQLDFINSMRNSY